MMSRNVSASRWLHEKSRAKALQCGTPVRQCGPWPFYSTEDAFGVVDYLPPDLTSNVYRPSYFVLNSVRLKRENWRDGNRPGYQYEYYTIWFCFRREQAMPRVRAGHINSEAGGPRQSDKWCNKSGMWRNVDDDTSIQIHFCQYLCIHDDEYHFLYLIS